MDELMRRSNLMTSEEDLVGMRMGSNNLSKYAVFKHSGRSRRERQIGEGLSGSIKSS